jgi:ABC-2 type transport system permease protein
VIRALIARTRFELRIFFRDRRSVFFTVVLPIMLLVIFGSIFGKAKLGHGVRFSQYFVAGMLASAILYSSFQQLAIMIPEERANGTLKRLKGSPLPPAAYFGGKFLATVVVYIIQATGLFVIGASAYHVQLPHGVGWLHFVWISLLGLLASALLGIAFSSLARDGRAASALASPVLLFLQFSSGVYMVFTTLPSWMQHVGALFPLKWLAQSMRGVFLPEIFAAAEPGHSFAFGETALVLSIWVVVGGILCWRRFAWVPAEQS